MAAGAGYLVGSWNATALRSTDPSPAQTVAMRFPSDWNVTAAVAQPAPSVERPVAAMVMGDPQLALFDSEPLMPPATQPQAPMQVATAEPPAAQAPQTAPIQAPILPPQARDMRPKEPATTVRPALAIHRPRQAAFLDDAQIAGIKEHLHLTPDQEQMWPAVASALRNIGIAKQREARLRGGSGMVNPDSAEVRNLKYAAMPLLMSFNDEQKDEVRNLVHVMGLDQLASQF